MFFERVRTSLQDHKKYAIPNEEVAIKVAANIEYGKTEFTTWTATLVGLIFALGGSFLLVEIQKSIHTRNTWLLWVGLFGLGFAVLSLGFGVTSYLCQMRGLNLNPHHKYLFTEARFEREDVEHRLATGDRVTEKIGVNYDDWTDSLKKHLKWVRFRNTSMTVQLVTFAAAVVLVFVDVIGFVFMVA